MEAITQKLGREPTTAELRMDLQARREALRVLYNRFRASTAKLVSEGVLRYDEDSHTYVSRIRNWGGVSQRHMKAGRLAIKLQTVISQQAMLLLELEHAIDRQERKLHENDL